jgi:hypothetical protein
MRCGRSPGPQKKHGESLATALLGHDRPTEGAVERAGLLKITDPRAHTSTTAVT